MNEVIEGELENLYHVEAKDSISETALKFPAS
jgi:hypothetical protein